MIRTEASGQVPPRLDDGTTIALHFWLNVHSGGKRPGVNVPETGDRRLVAISVKTCLRAQADEGKG